MGKSIKARNRHACHPVMRKGGVHEKSRGAKRAAEKRVWKGASREQFRDDSSATLVA